MHELVFPYVSEFEPAKITAFLTGFSTLTPYQKKPCLQTS